MTRLISLPKFVFGLGLATLATFTTANLNTAQAALKEGKDYTVLKQPASPNKRIEMAMSFLCVHCQEFTNKFNIVKKIEKIIADNPKSEFIEYQIVLPGQKYLEDLGRFRAVLYAQKRDDLIPQAYDMTFNQYKGQNPAVLKKWLATNLKRSDADVEKLWGSFAVNTFYNRQVEFTKKYNIVATPTFIVNGKYVLNLDAISAVETKDKPLTPDQIGDLVAVRLAEMIKLP